MNLTAYLKRIRGYLPKYPGPSRSISQEHVIGGTVAAAIILAAIFIVQPWNRVPPIGEIDTGEITLEEKVSIIEDLLQDINDAIMSLESQLIAQKEEFTSEVIELQDMLIEKDIELQDLYKYVRTLENQVGSLLDEIERWEVVVERYTWDYVALGIEYGHDESYVDYYADYIEADMGVIVRLHDWRLVGHYYSELLSQLRESQELRDLIREAEVITIDIVTFFPEELTEAVSENDTERIAEITASVKADIDAILDEILTLRSVNNTIIRTDNAFNCWIDEQKELDIFHIVKPIFDDIHGHVVAASSERNIPVAMTYQALNGPDGEEMPPEELLSTGIGMTYLNEAGHTRVAELYRELGYDPLGS
jgi:hypothetical protein